MTAMLQRIINFCKNWTLPVAISIGTIVYFAFAAMPALDGWGKWWVQAFSVILPAALFLVLFVTFCRIDFKKMRPHWWHFWALLAQLAMSAAIVAIIHCARLTGDSLILMECLLTCIIGPCAAASAVVTGKLGGDVESMTTFTFLSNIATAVLIPAFFPIVNPSADIGFIHSFSLILYKVLVVLVVPMGCAWVVKHYCHKLLEWIVARPNLSFYLWGGVLAIVTGSTMRNIVHASATWQLLTVIAAESLALCIVQFAMGRSLGHLFGHKIDCGQALGQKNTAFAIWISAAYLNPLASVGPGCYILWQNIANSFELWHYARATRK